VFSSSVSFCYDGNVYQKCSGVEYNPTTHICQGYAANPARCGSSSYNPLEKGCCVSTLFNLSNQRCQSNAVETKCGTGSSYYNPETQFCDGNSVLNKCGGKEYNPSNQTCQSNVIKDKCGTGSSYYDPSTQFCNGNSVLSKCGGSTYNPETQRCQSGVIETKCGTSWYSGYNSATQFCSGNSVYSKCNGSTYNPETQRCQNNIVETKCGTSWYDATNADLRCQSNVVQTKCETEWYSIATQVCEGEKVLNKCGGDVYDSSTKFCQSGTNAIKDLCGTQTYTSSQFCQAGTNTVLSLCGGNTYTTEQRCYSSVVETKCGTVWYAANASLRCENNVIETRCGTDWYIPSSNNYCIDGTLTTSKGIFTDSRDSKEYEYITIATQTWMAENLNYDVAGSKCYNNSESNCDKYGRLYDWAAAMGLASTCNSSTCNSQIQPKHQGICPDGWHIPSNADWNTLMAFVHSDNDLGSYTSNSTSNYAGKYLKAISGWNSYSGIVNLDTYGFSALPGGFGSSGGFFFCVGYLGGWWSASEYCSFGACLRDVYYYFEGAYWFSDVKYLLRSIRCLQD
jgi:uncharacterized protein (TIGR02145 family)